MIRKSFPSGATLNPGDAVDFWNTKTLHNSGGVWSDSLTREVQFGNSGGVWQVYFGTHGTGGLG